MSNSKEKQHSYEQLLPAIDGMAKSLGCNTTETTKEDLTVVLGMMGYLDHQYDKKNQTAQTQYYQTIMNKLENATSEDTGEMDDTFTKLCEILEKRGIKQEYIYYVKKLFAHNDKACHTQDNNTFVKHKYLEGYLSAKLITLLLKQDGLSYDADKLLSNLVGIANLLDDLLDIEDDYQKGVSEIPPSLKLKAQLLSNVIVHTINKFLCSGKINRAMIKHIAHCTGHHIKKKITQKDT